MKQDNIPWDDATLVQLKKFAVSVLGISYSPNIGEDTLRAKIRAAYGGDTITILASSDDEVIAPDAPAPPSDKPIQGKALRGSSAVDDPKVTITIAEVETAGGKRPVPVGVNGVFMLIPRGRQVEIPWRYYHALTLAIKTTYSMNEETNEIEESDVPSYPFSVNIMPSKDAIDAYLAADRVA